MQASEGSVAFSRQSSRAMRSESRQELGVSNRERPLCEFCGKQYSGMCLVRTNEYYCCRNRDANFYVHIKSQGHYGVYEAT